MEIDIEKLKRKDINEFEKFFMIYINRIYTIVYRVLNDHHYSEDVTMIVMNKIWQKIDYFKGESKLSTWVYSIAYNSALEFKRKEKIEFIEIPEDIKVEEDLINDIDAKEKERILKKEIEKLPENQRVAITLHYFEDMDYNEIANVMGVNL